MREEDQPDYSARGRDHDRQYPCVHDRDFDQAYRRGLAAPISRSSRASSAASARRPAVVICRPFIVQERQGFAGLEGL